MASPLTNPVIDPFPDPFPDKKVVELPSPFPPKENPDPLEEDDPEIIKFPEPEPF